ncbi:uncharacterized protein TRAVEDRAFT_105016, partial [Trametes versicolor FP-101664 SS1]|uniref:uncharacterized protein n=1 Tax=Trametes versicolor (strain FP-101664) TaxID=717944 RepID=UPI0004621943
NVICAVNVQHNCRDQKCQLANTRVVRQEHENTTQRAAEVRHSSVPDYVLNTGQMRSAALIMPLYPR